MLINNNSNPIQINNMKNQGSAKKTDTEIKDTVSRGTAEKEDDISKLKDFAAGHEKKLSNGTKIALMAGASLLMGAGIGGILVTLPMALIGLSGAVSAIAGGVTGLIAGGSIMSGFLEDPSLSNNSPGGLPLEPSDYPKNFGLPLEPCEYPQDFGLPLEPSDPNYGS